MTLMSRRADASPALLPRPMRRTAEAVLVLLGMAACLVVMGGFALVVNRIDEATFAQVVMPALMGEDTTMTVAQAHEAARVLGAWFGISLIVLLLLGTGAVALMRARPRRRSTGWIVLAAGLVCLLGSQLILYPVAFVFFVAAGLFALRPVLEESSS